ncbi:hypothetical protein [Providencia hangzhouensis]|uniref:hypothetical protein n=1 Tax=Providencia hangzhouensis TaxID=3031799 RepID=UPI0034DD442F
MNHLPARHFLPIPELQTRPFIMGEHLQAAWENSAQFIELLAENLACELWENHAEVALSLDTPEGQLHRRLVDSFTFSSLTRGGYPYPYRHTVYGLCPATRLANHDNGAVSESEG